jgi:hypothetical protein
MGGRNQSPTSHECTTIISDICDELSCIPTVNIIYSNNSNKNNPYVLLAKFVAHLLKQK